MTTTTPVPAGYTPIDLGRNLVTVAAAVCLTVFHRDVSAFVPAAAVLVAGIDVTATHLIKGKGGILHRIEAALAGLATTVGQVVHLLPSTVPAAVAKGAAEASAAAGEVGSLVTPLTAVTSATLTPPTTTHVQVNVGTVPPQAPPTASALVPAGAPPGAGSGGAAADPAVAVAS